MPSVPESVSPHGLRVLVKLRARPSSAQARPGSGHTQRPCRGRQGRTQLWPRPLPDLSPTGPLVTASQPLWPSLPLTRRPRPGRALGLEPPPPGSTSPGSCLQDPCPSSPSQRAPPAARLTRTPPVTPSSSCSTFRSAIVTSRTHMPAVFMIIVSRRHVSCRNRGLAYCPSPLPRGELRTGKASHTTGCTHAHTKGKV